MSGFLSLIIRKNCPEFCEALCIKLCSITVVLVSCCLDFAWSPCCCVSFLQVLNFFHSSKPSRSYLWLWDVLLPSDRWRKDTSLPWPWHETEDGWKIVLEYKWFHSLSTHLHSAGSWSSFNLCKKYQKACLNKIFHIKPTAFALFYWFASKQVSQVWHKEGLIYWDSLIILHRCYLYSIPESVFCLFFAH